MTRTGQKHSDMASSYVELQQKRNREQMQQLQMQRQQSQKLQKSNLQQEMQLPGSNLHTINIGRSGGHSSQLTSAAGFQMNRQPASMMSVDSFTPQKTVPQLQREPMGNGINRMNRIINGMTGRNRTNEPNLRSLVNNEMSMHVMTSLNPISNPSVLELNVPVCSIPTTLPCLS